MPFPGLVFFSTRTVAWAGVWLWTGLFLGQVCSAGAATVSYGVDAGDFPNPERGFYKHFETFAGGHVPMPDWAENYRLNGVFDVHGSYSVKPTLILRLFYLDTFVGAAISTEYLDLIAADFDKLREMGFKAIVRFAYNKDESRPFNEPSKERILGHLAQLRPVLREHRDVIALVQHGFIGAYGEGYFTDVFSNAGQNFTAANWVDRAEVLEALLEAVPRERMVQVRLPQQKQKHLHGPGAPTTTAAMSTAQAHTGLPISRLGHHNDCLLASATDVGTFVNSDTGEEGVETARLRSYAAADSAFVVVGGETCGEFVPADNCVGAGGRADSDLELFHYSFLNQDWNGDVNDDWVAQGCMDAIIRRLGYRLHLVRATSPDETRPGRTATVDLTIRNVGYAAPYNRRGVELILRRQGETNGYHANLTAAVDPRFWLPGMDHLVSVTLSLPDAIPIGTYDLLLHLPDPMPSLYGRTPYAVRLANTEARTPEGVYLGMVWEEATGFHDLGLDLVVNNTAGAPLATGAEIPFLAEPSLVWPSAEIERGEGGMIEVTFRGVPGESYAVEHAQALVDPVSWTTLTTVVAGASGQFGVVEVPGPGGRYYRASRM